MKRMNPLFSIFRRLIVAIICVCTANAVAGCGDYIRNLKSEYGYTVVRHKVKTSDIEAIEQALDKHGHMNHKTLTKDEAKAEWESFLSDINDEDVEITDGGYVKIRFHEVVPITVDEIINWIEGSIVGEKTWK